MNSNYKVTIEYSAKELTAKEKIQLKDITDSYSLDSLTQESENKSVIIIVSNVVVLNVHNEKAENTNYSKLVIIDNEGNKFTSSSNSLTEKVCDIIDDLKDIDYTDDITLKIYRKDSKNFKGKQFLTCSLM